MQGIALAVGVSVEKVAEVAQVRPSLGRFELPERADLLTQTERAAVLAVIDAILNAS